MGEEEEMGRDEGEKKQTKVCQLNLDSSDCLLDYFPSPVSAFFMGKKSGEAEKERN